MQSSSISDYFKLLLLYTSSLDPHVVIDLYLLSLNGAIPTSQCTAMCLLTTPHTKLSHRRHETNYSSTVDIKEIGKW